MRNSQNFLQLELKKKMEVHLSKKIFCRSVGYRICYLETFPTVENDLVTRF